MAPRKTKKRILTLLVQKATYPSLFESRSQRELANFLVAECFRRVTQPHPATRCAVLRRLSPLIPIPALCGIIFEYASYDTSSPFDYPRFETGLLRIGFLFRSSGICLLSLDRGLLRSKQRRKNQQLAKLRAHIENDRYNFLPSEFNCNRLGCTIPGVCTCEKPLVYSPPTSYSYTGPLAPQFLQILEQI